MRRRVKGKKLEPTYVALLREGGLFFGRCFHGQDLGDDVDAGVESVGFGGIFFDVAQKEHTALVLFVAERKRIGVIGGMEKGGVAEGSAEIVEDGLAAIAFEPDGRAQFIALHKPFHGIGV